MRQTQNQRSVARSRGRGHCLFITASCCRRARFSKTISRTWPGRTRRRISEQSNENIRFSVKANRQQRQLFAVGYSFDEAQRGQDAPNEVFIDRDAERQSNLLSDSGAAPGGIALFGSVDRVHESLGRTLGPGLAPAFRREEQAVLVLDQDVVKVQ